MAIAAHAGGGRGGAAGRRARAERPAGRPPGPGRTGRARVAVGERAARRRFLRPVRVVGTCRPVRPAPDQRPGRAGPSARCPIPARSGGDRHRPAHPGHQARARVEPVHRGRLHQPRLCRAAARAVPGRPAQRPGPAARRCGDRAGSRLVPAGHHGHFAGKIRPVGEPGAAADRGGLVRLGRRDPGRAAPAGAGARRPARRQPGLARRRTAGRPRLRQRRLGRARVRPAGLPGTGPWSRAGTDDRDHAALPAAQRPRTVGRPGHGLAHPAGPRRRPVAQRSRAPARGPAQPGGVGDRSRGPLPRPARDVRAARRGPRSPAGRAGRRSRP